jgi:uroporphyrinogen decarboxylase
MTLSGRERFVRSILFEPVDRPARTDMFCLVREATGRDFPSEEELERSAGRERERLVGDCVEIYCRIAGQYDHDCIFVWHPLDGSANLDILSALRRAVGNEKAVLGLVPHAVWGLEQIGDHMDFAVRLAEDMPGLHAEARRMLDHALSRVRALAEAGADMAYMPSDIACNSGPYFAPAVYEELVLPYAQELFAEIRKSGLLGTYHTDGNIMKLLDRIMDSGAHALQSIDPMAGMDIKEVKRVTHGRLALIGNVQCNLLQEGPEEAIRASARYCLEHGSPGSGYVYMASNSIFEGMPLRNYDIMQDEYRRYIADR